MNIFLLLLLIIPQASLATSTAGKQQEKWYSIEVVAFTKAKSSQIKEQWLASPTAEVIGNDTDMPVPGTVQQVQSVPNSEMQLTGHAYSLNQAPGFIVRAHQAWRQQGIEKDNAPWIELETRSEKLNGKIRVSLASYLHADFKIILLNPDWSPAMPASTTESSRLQSRFINVTAHRRLRIGELHYIDHPLAGLLIKIERYEIKDDPISPTAEGQPKTAVKDESNSQITIGNN